MFLSGSVAVYPAVERGGAEERFLAIGQSQGARWIFAVFALREREKRTLIRPISARYMHRKEVEHYERQKEDAQSAAAAEKR